MRTPEHFLNNQNPSWCSGCLFHNFLTALTQMFSEKQIERSKINVISGIGCSSRLPLYLNTFGMHTIHGRALPVAVGARLSRPDIPVIVTAGDGDLFSIGIGHFVHAAQKNFRITVLCMDNRMFAMTKNQSSPTSDQGHYGTLTPQGKLEPPLDVVDFAISCNASFVARTCALDKEHMNKIVTEAFDHHGFSFVHVIAPCSTFDKQSLISFPDLVDIDKTFPHDNQNRMDAQRNFQITENSIPVGVFYRQNRPVFEEQIRKV